jgi:hypothetical protein
MTKSYDLNKPKKEPKRNDKPKVKEEVKEESYEDMLRREKVEKHKKEGVHIT